MGIAESQLDDAVQELWVIVYRRLPEFEGRSELRTWLFGIALNVRRNFSRAERRRPALVALPVELTSMAPDPLSEHEGREAWLLVERFMATLDEVRRAVFVASCLEGMSPAETAEATGLEVTAIYHRVRSLRRSFEHWAAAHRGQP